MDKKKRTKTVEFTVRISTPMEQLKGMTEMMAEIIDIQPDDTPERIVNKAGCLLQYSDSLFGTPFLLKKVNNKGGIIIMPQNMDERDARVIATQAMLFASSSIFEENKESVYHTLKKGETCCPVTQNEKDFLAFETRHILMPEEKVIKSIDMHQKGTQINMKAVAADFNVRPYYATVRAAELGLIKVKE